MALAFWNLEFQGLDNLLYLHYVASATIDGWRNFPENSLRINILDQAS